MERLSRLRRLEARRGSESSPDGTPLHVIIDRPLAHLEGHLGPEAFQQTQEAWVAPGDVRNIGRTTLNENPLLLIAAMGTIRFCFGLPPVTGIRFNHQTPTENRIPRGLSKSHKLHPTVYLKACEATEFKQLCVNCATQSIWHRISTHMFLHKSWLAPFCDVLCLLSTDSSTCQQTVAPRLRHRCTGYSCQDSFAMTHTVLQSSG